MSLVERSLALHHHIKLKSVCVHVSPLHLSPQNSLICMNGIKMCYLYPLSQGSGTFFAWRATFTIFFFISEEPQKDGYKKKFGYLTNSYFYSTEFFFNTFSTSFKSYGTSNLNCKWQWEMTKVTTT